jgi:hypothetical protein
MKLRVIAGALFFTSAVFAWTKPVTTSPTGKPVPKSSDARSMVRKAARACGDAMRAQPIAAQADEASYQIYVISREWAAKLEPGIMTYDASLDAFEDITPSKIFPTCDRYFGDYASGVGAADLPLSQLCIGRAQPYLKQAEGRLAAQSAGGRVGFTRSGLEQARIVLYSKYDQGLLFGRCATNDKFKKAFLPLKQKYDQLDASISALEAAKGIKFVPVPDTLPNPLSPQTGLMLLHYNDLKTGQAVANASQY